MKHMGYLDGWRGLAISAVLISHFVAVPWLDLGRAGVDLFFVLSGLLMSRMLFEERTPLGTFYRRRFSRIAPVFLVFIAAMAALASSQNVNWRTDEIVASVLFVRTYWPNIPIWDTAVPAGHLWSLNVEEHSYMLLALLAAIPFLRRREWLAVLVLAAASLCVTLWYWMTPEIRATEFDLRTECAALALLLSAGYRQVRLRRVQPWMPLVALIAAIACYSFDVHAGARVFIAPFLLAFAVNHIGDSYRWTLRALEFAPLRMVGIWSYSLYLWQQPFHKSELPAVAAVLLAFGCALASYYLIEMPARKWLNEHWRPKRALYQSRGVAPADL